ncbi:hypothetical protein IJ732_05345 [bacterium]|nr:hypothetical protein [bacterium]
MSITVSTQTQHPQNKVQGHLVHQNPIKSAGNRAKGLVQSGKYLADGLNAKGDDYSVGKINDLTTKLGSLGIAATLASLTKNPVSKAMEFTGLVSFLTAMAVWPKVIAAPIKARTGFDVNQEYVDSYGRQKRFFEDPQYLPWDLWKKEDLDKVGDKLHISKNIANRSEKTQDKMKQISTQANTLWMLTTGFATPLMASLMGNYAGKYVEKVTETSRVQGAIKQTGMEDFTKANKSTLQKIFVDPVAKLMSANKKAVDATFLDKVTINDTAKIDEMLKNLDSAYDAIFGKGTDAAFEFNKASMLYKNVPADMKLTQFDEKTGMNVIKDASGKVINKIHTKNVDGVSLMGDKWKVLPNKMADILGISPKEYKQITKNILNAGENGAVNHESEELAEILIRKFAGAENKENLKKALNKAESILTPAMKELDDASNSYKAVLDKTVNAMKSIVTNDASAKKVLDDKIKYIGEAQQTRLSNKVLNTKISWTSPIRILDIIAKHDNVSTVEAKAALKKELSEFIYGVTPHHINNNFDDVVKGNFVAPAKYVQGIKKYFGKLSENTKAMMSNADLVKNIDNNTETVAKKLLKLINPADKGKNFENICEWLGKAPDKFLTDAAKQNGIYRGWLKKVGGAFTILTGITLLATTQFGKANKYNKD